MKCEKCGRNEANYHYTSNINGKVTKMDLCSECAQKLGIEDNLFADADKYFEDMFDSFFSRSLGRMLSPWSRFDMPIATMLLPRIEVRLENAEKEETENKEEPKLDPAMQKRRELNMLREQMKKAAENEEYEKAAEIRDKIRKMESEE